LQELWLSQLRLNGYRQFRPDRQFFSLALWFKLDEDPAAISKLIAATAVEYEQRASSRAAGIAAVEKQRRELVAELRAASARRAELMPQS
jgi:hypothetical protein